jgi:tRNA-dihydrouridine synthase
MEFDLAAYLNRPLRIGGKTIPKRLVFAPMTYLGHSAFRELLSGFGGFGLLFLRDVQCQDDPHRKPPCFRLFQVAGRGVPLLVCQILGSEPERMAEAARRIEARLL